MLALQLIPLGCVVLGLKGLEVHRGLHKARDRHVTGSVLVNCVTFACRALRVRGEDDIGLTSQVCTLGIGVLGCLHHRALVTSY